jgi:hypothetical protein
MHTDVEVWENQRWAPGKGWGAFRLPVDRPSWSDKAGKLALRKEGFLLPPGWQWTGPWAVRAPPESPEGWMYAVDYTVPTRFCSFKSNVTSCVRRRCWHRKRELETPLSAAVSPTLDHTNAPIPTKAPTTGVEPSAGLTSSRYAEQGMVHPRETVFYGFVPTTLQTRPAEYEHDQHRGVAVFLPIMVDHFAKAQSKKDRLPTLTLSKNTLHAIYAHGIPQALRNALWMAMSGGFERKHCCLGHYRSLLEAIDVAELHNEKHEINIDVFRTFPLHPAFANGEGVLSHALRRILFAASAHAQMAYQQAFSYLGGLLLLNVDDEEDAFWLLVALVCDGGVLPDGYFSDRKLDADLNVARQLVDARVDRRFARHIEQNNLDVSLFANGWMQALMAAHLPPPTACRVLDVIFAEWSSGVVVRLVLGFLAISREAIMNITDIGTLGQLANNWARALWSPNSVFQLVWEDGLARSIEAVRNRALADEDDRAAPE